MSDQNKWFELWTDEQNKCITYTGQSVSSYGEGLLLSKSQMTTLLDNMGLVEDQ